MILLFLLLSAHAATVTPDTVTAAAPAEAIVTVDSFGRYAVSVSSELGAALTLVDRMAGPLPTRGQPGVADGRLDVFLDRGTYQVRVTGAAEDAGQAELSVTPFTELQPSEQALQDGATVSATLGDHDQRSYWVYVTAPERLQVEAAGRHLADLRIWKDGTWLYDAQPRCQVATPVIGQPLRDCTLDVRLEAGLYRLTAYGGPGLAWAEEAEGDAFHLRRGVPDLGDIGQQSRTISPFGVDRFRVDASYVHLSLPAAAPVRLSAWDGSRSPFLAGGTSTAISESSRYPFAALSLRRKQAWYVTVQGAAGQAYTIQHFTPTQPTTRLARHGSPSWVTTMSTGTIGDDIDTTALLLREEDGLSTVQATAGIPLRAGVRYARRVNLPSRPVTLLLDVADDGLWRFELNERDGRIQVMPLLLHPPSDYQPPPFKRSPQELPLAAGLHLLTIQADEPGTAALDIRPRRGADDLPVLPHQASSQFPAVQTDDPDASVLLVQFGDPTRMRGVIQRPMPLDISEPLAVSLPPRAVIDLPLDVTERGGLVVDGADGVVEVRLDRAVFPPGDQVWPMGHDLRLINLTDDPQQVIARLVPPEQALPSLPDAAQRSLPDFPEIRPGEALPLDLDAGAQSTLTLKVDEPALYAVTSEGLLAVQGTVRTRTTTRLDQRSLNGPGRNFQLLQYLREGEYQITAQTVGRSAGHLRVRLDQTTLHDGGDLQPDRPARAALSAGDGVVYRLQVPKAGRWVIRSSAEGRVPRCRLEDADGWPLIPPNQPADLALDLDAGTYRLVLLPSAVDERRVTSLSVVTAPDRLAGHGPHPITLDAPVDHRWQEPLGEESRGPDLWTFSLAAPADLSVTLSDGMHGQLFRDNVLQDELSGWVEPGDYQLAVRSSRPDHGRPYTVSIETSQLTAGRDRQCSAPCTIPISADGLTEVSTAGDADVRLRLRDGRHLLASSDDRPGGWNAQILADLPAGVYTLEVSPVGTSQAETTVSVRAPTRRTVAPLAPGQRVTLSPGDDVLEVPVSGPSGGALLVEAQSNETVAVAIVQDGQLLSSGAGTRARTGAWLSRAPATLRIWSVDRREMPVTVTLEHTALFAKRPGNMSAPPLVGFAAFSVATQRGGAFSVAAEGPVLACTSAGQPCAPVDGLVATDGEELVLIAEAATPARRVGLRVSESVLEAGRWTRLDVPAGGARWEAARGDGPVLVMAQTNQGQPGVRLVDAASPADTGSPKVVATGGSRFAVAARDSLSSPTIEIWSAGRSAALPARVRVWRFPPPTVERLSGTEQDLPVPAGEARRRLLPGGGPMVLSLPDGFAAIVTEAGAPQVYYADDGAQVIALGRAEAVTLLNPTDASGLARIVSTGGTPADLVLRPDTPIEQAVARRQRQRAWVPPREDGGWTLQAAGSVESVRWMGMDGSVRIGTQSLSLGAGGGWLEIEAGPGTAVLWLVDPMGGSGLVSAADSRPPVALPARIALDGASGKWAVTGDPRAILQVRTAVPAVLAVESGAGDQATAVLVQGGSLDVPLSGGAAAVSVRALAGGRLSGELSLLASLPIPMQDGVNPALALAPGERRWMDFAVARPEQAIGIGVQSSSDQIEVVLMDAAGQVLGSGPVQRHDLPAGRYLLGLSLPPGARPATAKAALVGRVPRGNTPPEDIIRQYVEGEQ